MSKRLPVTPPQTSQMLQCGIAAGLFSLILWLYPGDFRQKFGQEMSDVFKDHLIETSQLGSISFTQTCLFEYYGLLKDAGAIRLHQARKSGIEQIIALLVFSLPTLAIANYNQGGSGWLFLAASMVLAAGLLAGLQHGFPRWTLPYLGVGLSVFSFVFLYQWAADLYFIPALRNLEPSVLKGDTQLLLQAGWSGLVWLGLFTAIAALLGLLALLRRLHLVMERLRQDWTQVSYVIYSGSILVLALIFSEQDQQPVIATAASICLAAGAWLYLHAGRPWQRVLALVCGLSLAMLTAAAGMLPPLPSRQWVAWVVGRQAEATGILAAQRTMFELILALLVLLVPALLTKFLRRSANQ